jgi:glycogen synthase
MINGMARDYSWEQPAREYAAVYEEAAQRRAQGNNNKTNSKELTA